MNDTNDTDAQANEGGRLASPVGERDHAQGRADAPVTLVEYGDYECPYCGHANAIVKEIQRRLGDRVRFVFRNFPLADVHPHAEHAAEAAEAAAAQGKFWEMHDYLYGRQQALGDEDLAHAAATLGLDADRVTRDLGAHTYLERVREDLRGGIRSGVEGTPSFFINGVRHDESYDLETMMAAIARAG